MNFSAKTAMAAIISAAAIITSAAGAESRLPRSTAAEQGIDPHAIELLVDSLQAIPKTEIHHLMIVRNGYVVAEAHNAPWQASDVHTLFSCSKTMVSLAVGIAISENRLRLTDRVASFFPDMLPDTITDAMAALTVRDLLTMDAGAYTPQDIHRHDTCWERAFLNNTKLGTDKRFRYDSFCTYMLAGIVQRVSGSHSLLAYLRPRLLDPLGIDDADWELSPTGINTGGWGMRLHVESMAKIGQMILDGGKWNGRQIVPADYVAEMQKVQIEWHPGKEPSDLNQGYGYQMWRCLEPGVARADGAYGQYIIVDPARRLVVAMNGISLDHGPYDELACVWRQLMPGVSDSPIKVNAKQQRSLEKKLATLTLPTLKGKAQGPTFNLTLADNQLSISSLQLLPANGSRTMVVTMADGTCDSIPLGHKQWARHTTLMAPPYTNGAFSLPLTRISGHTLPYSTGGCYGYSANTFTARVAYTNWFSTRTFTVSGLNSQQPTVTITDNFAPGKPVTIPCKN